MRTKNLKSSGSVMKDRLLTILITANIIIGVFFLFGEDRAEANKAIHQEVVSYNPSSRHVEGEHARSVEMLKRKNAQGYTATSISCPSYAGCVIILTK